MLTKVDLILKEYGCIKYVLVVVDSNSLEIVFALLIEIITFYI